MFGALGTCPCFRQLPIKDKFVTRCKKITEEIDETELNIGYAFMTEEDMENANFPQFLSISLFVGMLINPKAFHTQPSEVED